MIRRRLVPLAIAAAVIAPALTGCTLVTNSPTPAATVGAPASAPATTPADAPSDEPTTGTQSGAPGKGTGLGSPLPGGKTPPAGSGGGLVDPCTLLSKAEVTQLTGKPISQMDPDGLSTKDTNRYCQWQLSGGQLAIFTSRTSAAEFKTASAQGTPVAGVGDAAYSFSGHLFVLGGDMQLDVYARLGSDAQNLKVAKLTAAKVLPKL